MVIIANIENTDNSVKNLPAMRFNGLPIITTELLAQLMVLKPFVSSKTTNEMMIDSSLESTFLSWKVLSYQCLKKS